jgi:hypothetical protein
MENDDDDTELDHVRLAHSDLSLSDVEGILLCSSSGHSPERMQSSLHSSLSVVGATTYDENLSEQNLAANLSSSLLFADVALDLNALSMIEFRRAIFNKSLVLKKEFKCDFDDGLRK